MSRPSSTGPSANKPCSKQPPPQPQHAPSPAAPPAAATISAAGPGSSAVPAAAAVISGPGGGGGAGPVSPQHHELTSLFECPVCFDYVLPPILQCQAGHLVCNQCRQKLSCCPTCRGALTPSIRNLAMEKVASAVLFPCKVSPGATRAPPPGDLPELLCPPPHSYELRGRWHLSYFKKRNVYTCPPSPTPTCPLWE